MVSTSKARAVMGLPEKSQAKRTRMKNASNAWRSGWQREVVDVLKWYM